MSLSPKTVVDRVASFKKEYETNPTDGLFGAWERMWEIQKQLATYFKARPQDIYLRLNVTYVMNDFILALKLPKDSEILISTLEYGAIKKICEFKAHSEGHTLKNLIFTIPNKIPKR